MTEPANWRLHRSIKTTGNHLVLVVLVFLTLYPFFFMLTTSLKSIAQFYHGIWGVIFPLHWDNYVTAFQELQSYILNSVAVSAGSALGVVALGSVTAYVFAFYRFPAKNVLFYAILSILMIPGVLTLVPAFMVVKQLGLLNTRWVMILPYISGGQVIAIFILRSFFETIPRDLCDSARVDGANDFHIYRMIVYPLAKPIIGVIVIMDILGTWNNFIWPYVTLSNAKCFVLPVGLLSFAGQYGTRYGEMFAGYTIASIPLILLFCLTTRTFLRGIASGALKA